MKYVMLKMFIFNVLCTLFLSNAIVICQPKVVVFDLNGVLFQSKTPLKLAVKHIGLKTLIRYILNPYTNTYNFRKMTFNFLHNLKQRTEDADFASVPTDENGVALPLIMEEWLSGTSSGIEIMSCIKQALKDHLVTFTSVAEKKIILKIIRLIFDPHLFIQTQQLHPNAIDIIQKLKDNGFQVYALSNWDKKSFVLMQEKHQHFFSLFDGIMISGNEGLVKPSPLLYKAFLHKYNLNANSCIFIDDQIGNVTAAQAIGMHAFVCPCIKKRIWTYSKANLALACKAIEKISKKSG